MSKLLTPEQWETIEEFEPTVVQIYVTVRFSFGSNIIPTRNYVHLHIDVDTHGMVSLSDGNVQYDEASDIYDWLTENDWAEWKAIGPEDSELFATAKLMRVIGDGR